MALINKVLLWILLYGCFAGSTPTMLQNSQLADFSADNRRLSVFIQPTCEYLNKVPHMLKNSEPTQPISLFD